MTNAASSRKRAPRRRRVSTPPAAPWLAGNSTTASATSGDRPLTRPTMPRAGGWAGTMMTNPVTHAHPVTDDTDARVSCGRLPPLLAGRRARPLRPASMVPVTVRRSLRTGDRTSTATPALLTGLGTWWWGWKGQDCCSASLRCCSHAARGSRRAPWFPEPPPAHRCQRAGWPGR